MPHEDMPTRPDEDEVGREATTVRALGRLALRQEVELDVQA